MRANLASLLRRLGRASFRLADRLNPDWITLAMDEASKTEPAAAIRNEHLREVAKELHDIAGSRPTPFKRKSARLRTLR
jgi:hypothetical protein